MHQGCVALPVRRADMPLGASSIRQPKCAPDRLRKQRFDIRPEVAMCLYQRSHAVRLTRQQGAGALFLEGMAHNAIEAVPCLRHDGHQPRSRLRVDDIALLAAVGNELTRRWICASIPFGDPTRR